MNDEDGIIRGHHLDHRQCPLTSHEQSIRTVYTSINIHTAPGVFMVVLVTLFPVSEMEMVKPGWLGGLLEESFFVPCMAHESRRKNEKNMFCLACCASLCAHCAPGHHSHPLIQVRRYVYNDVVRLEDLEKLIDCSCVQPYTINSAKVIFLKQRPQSRPFKGSGNICLTCDRILQEPFHFCSLSCKVDHVMLQGGALSNILFRFDESDFAFPHIEGLRMANSDLTEDEPEAIAPESIESSTGESARLADGGKRTVKGSAGGFLPRIVLSLSSRRKGAPQRSPLA